VARGIAIRAANHARREYLPTYLALRFMFERSGQTDLDDWVANLARATCITERSLPYRGYRIVKSISEEEIQYRECFAPSPLALLVEAYILSEISEFEAFQAPRQNVYSYRWPSRKSGHSYQFFLSGYKARQRKIAELLSRANEQSLAVFITDIERFYPSANSEKLLNRFEARLRSTTLEDGLARGFRHAAAQMFAGGRNTGIPIGSALGHLFGHIALEKVDISLSERFGESYLRYVDDIVIVAPRDMKDEVERAVREAVSQEGFTLNADKTFWVRGAEWTDTNLNENLQQRFEDIKNDMLLFLTWHPQSFSALRDALRSEGFNFPLSVFRSMATYSRFRAIFPKALKHIWKRRQWLPTLESIIAEGKELKRDMLEHYKALVTDSTPERSPLDTKLDAQRLKWCLNRLMYLFAPGELTCLRTFIRRRLESPGCIRLAAW